MQKRAPTLGNILVIVLFALSCFGLLLFLWESFGGPVPLKPKGYRFTVQLQRTLALAEQSDVRISGVPVGHVISLKADNKTGRTLVTIEMDHQYAPVNSKDRLILRQKTLLGETYVELLPPHGPFQALPDGGRIPISHVEPSVTLDDILSALEPKTRKAFQIWMQSSAAAFNGRGEQINSGFAELQPFVENANKLVSVLASQETAVRDVVHNTGVVFDALTERDEQFRGLIENGERTFHALARSSGAFANAFRRLPAFEQRSQATLKELDRLANDANPLLDQLRPAERQLAPLLQKIRGFTPAFDSVLTDLGPLSSASKTGLPALERTLGLLTPLLGHVSPTLHNFDPFLKFLSDYIPELQAFFGNVTAATQAHDGNSDDSGGSLQHYLRILQTITPEGLAVYSKRIGTNRANPYFQPGAFRQLGSGGLQVYSASACADSAPEVSETNGNATVSKSIIEQLIANHVINAPESTENTVPAPACNQQSPFDWEGVTSQFPHVTAASTSK
jgi:phospholipid/cholesterol/gamma-HCH transport system substrate-binding protein